MAVAALWGFAEATVFFVVPDVLVSAVTLLYGLRAALRASLAAAAGAVAGGLLMALAAASHPEAVRALLVDIPAIGPGMVARAFAAFRADGLAAMAAGAATGVPYKIFAAAAGETGAPLAPFLAASFAVRFARFALAAVAVVAVRRLVPVGDRAAAALLAVFWLAFYAVYFSVAG